MRVTPTNVKQVKPGDRVLSLSTGKATYRTVKSIKVYNRSVRITFASKQSHVFDAYTTLPVVR